MKYNKIIYKLTLIALTMIPAAIMAQDKILTVCCYPSQQGGEDYVLVKYKNCGKEEACRKNSSTGTKTDSWRCNSGAKNDPRVYDCKSNS